MTRFIHFSVILLIAMGSTARHSSNLEGTAQQGTCENPTVIASEDFVLDTLHTDASDGSDFFEFTVPQDGYLSFSTCQIFTLGNDDFLNVYEGNCGNLIASEQGNISCVRNSKWESVVSAGTKYIFEWGIDYDQPDQGQDNLNPVFFYEANYQGYNCNSGETIECLGEFEPEFRRVVQWFRWEAPYAGLFEMGMAEGHGRDLNDIGLDMNLYKGTGCGSKTLITDNDPSGLSDYEETITFSAATDEIFFFKFSDQAASSAPSPTMFIARKGFEPLEELLVEVKKTFSDGVILEASQGPPGTGSYQWYDADTDQEINGANYSRYKPIEDGNYYAERTSGNCILTSETVVITLNNGSGDACNDPYVIDFAGESVLDTLIIDGSNGADYYEFTVPANGYMTISSCRANESDSDHYIQTYFDSGCALQVTGAVDDCDGHFDLEMQVFEGDVLGIEIGIDPNEPIENQIDQVFDVVFYYREDLQGFSCATAHELDCLGEFEVDVRGAEQWFSWVSPEAGEFDISLTQGAAFDFGIVMEVYQGADCDNLTLIETTTDDPHYLLFAGGGVQYYFRFLDELNETPNGPYKGRVLGVDDNNSTSETIHLAECDDYFFDNQVITESGIYHGAFTNVLGCDSLVTLNLTINESETNSVTEFAFSNFEFDGSTLTTSGIYNATFTNVLGCDSLVSLDLTILNGIGWEAGAWSNMTGPTTSDLAVITEDYSTGIHGEFDMDDLKVEAGVTLTIDAGTFLEVRGNIENDGTVIVKSGGSIITNEGNYTGNPMTFIKETRYADDRYSMVGSPVFDDAGNTTDLLGPIVYSYDESIAYNEGTEDGINRWIANQSVALSSGKGYAAAGQQTITISGIPTDGDVTLDLGRTEDGSTGSENWGWHLVSNPYPASLDINEFFNTNEQIQGSIALWDDPGSNNGRGDNGDYLIANTIGSVGGPNGGQFEGYISSMQGFFVQVGDGQSGELQFTMDMRSTSNNADGNFFRATEIPSIKLSISNEEGNFSETLVGFPEDATQGMDRLYDAVKLKSQSEFNISSLLENQSLAIQGLPLENDMQIPLSIDHKTGGKTNFTLTTSHLSDHFSAAIRDPFGEENELWNEIPVELTISGGKNQKGYSLLFRSNEVLHVQEEPTFQVFLKDKSIVIRNTESFTSEQIKLLDLMGKEMNVETESEGLEYRMRKPMTSGIYILLIESSDGIKKRKILIK